MKTRRKDGGAPDPAAPWDEIMSGLWMGGHHWATPDGYRRAVVVGAEFDLVVSLFTADGHGPAAGVPHRVVPVPDGPLDAGQLAAVQAVARTAAEAVAAGRSVLVRCRAGYNRSGLVVAQALVELGLDAPEAVRLVRARRSPWALHNELFVEYLATGLDTARLLASLEAPPP